MTTPDLPPVGATVTDAEGLPYLVVANEYGTLFWRNAVGNGEWHYTPAFAPLGRSLTAAWRAEQRLAAIDAACLEVCRDNHGPTVGADAVDPDAGRYVCLNEDGEPFIDTSDPVEVIRTLDRLWWETSERCEKQEQRIKSLIMSNEMKEREAVWPPHGTAIRPRSDVPLTRALDVVRFYAERLAVEKPQTYEVLVGNRDGDVRLSDACALALAHIATFEALAREAKALDDATVPLSAFDINEHRTKVARLVSRLAALATPGEGATT